MEPIVFLGALVVLAAWSIAALASTRGGGTPASRRVALLLFIVGADVATSIIGLLRVLPPRDANAVLSIHWMTDAAIPPLALLFMARALDTPVARVLRRRPVELALATLAIVGPLATWVALHRDRSLSFIPALFGYIALGFLIGFLLALQGWRRAQGEERRRAGVFALAFGILDVAWGLAFGVVALGGMTTGLQLVYGGGALLFALLLGYGILQHRLLGIDVKLRFAISRSTVAAAFIAVFFVASEGAQLLFSGGNQWAGLVAAGGLVFALAPLQRAADRLAERAVPVAGAPAPAPIGAPAFAHETYRILLHRMLRDGRIDRREEAALAHAATSLGLTPQDAVALRHEVEDEHARSVAE